MNILMSDGSYTASFSVAIDVQSGVSTDYVLGLIDGIRNQRFITRLDISAPYCYDGQIMERMQECNMDVNFNGIFDEVICI